MESVLEIIGKLTIAFFRLLLADVLLFVGRLILALILLFVLLPVAWILSAPIILIGAAFAQGSYGVNVRQNL
jgi:hypothetical protein